MLARLPGPLKAADGLRVALVHDWLTGMRGGEKVLEVFCEQWPGASLFTLLRKRGSVSPVIERLQPRTSLLQWLPAVHRYYRCLLPVMPLAARWRVPACDLIISSSHCVAKAVAAPPGVPHLCYCHTPMRYAWSMRSAYFGAGPMERLKARLAAPLLAGLRSWDRRTASRVTHFVANSRTVQRRIAECYGRDSHVIYPPVDTDFYRPAAVPRDDYYLAVSAFVPYKRLQLAIAACNRLRRRLVMIGTGSQLRRLKAQAGRTVEFLGWQPDEVIREHFQHCRALLFPGEEDFGIVPVEAMACGAPVIAYDRGGAAETVLPLGRRGATGLLFAEQTEECLAEAILQFESCGGAFSAAAGRQRALQFSRRRFTIEFTNHVQTILHRQMPAYQNAA